MSGNIREPEEQLTTLEKMLIDSGLDKAIAKRIVILCSDYAERKYIKWKKGRIKIEKVRVDELYNMCKELKNTRNFNGLIEDIKKKLLEMSTQNE